MQSKSDDKIGSGDCITNNASKIRVLIVDDHAIVREGLAAIVSRQPDMEVVADTGSGKEGLALFRSLVPT